MPRIFALVLGTGGLEVVEKIYINKLVPGDAPETIRRAWIDIVIEVASEEELESVRDRRTNKQGHVVSVEKAIEALRAAGRHEAADLWVMCLEGMSHTSFPVDCYDVIQ